MRKCQICHKLSKAHICDECLAHITHLAVTGELSKLVPHVRKKKEHEKE